MWDYIINIYLSELLNKKTKEFIINESYIYIYIYIKEFRGQFTFYT